MNLLWVEMRRAVRRRAVLVLILLALLGCAVAGVVAFVSSSGKTLAELQSADELHPAVLTNWWVAARADGVVLLSSFFLLLGGVIGGASVAGAEWHAGTITTVLTWEPRRVRLILARTAACGIVAFGVALALQVIYLAAYVPAVAVHGTAAGADFDWWMSLILVITRTALLTGIAAVLAVALAMLGRNTAFALAAVFMWVAVIENLIRDTRPGLAQYLWAENIGIVVPWRQTTDAPFARGPVLALSTIGLYTAVIVAAATIAFQRRDIAGSS